MVSYGWYNPQTERFTATSDLRLWLWYSSPSEHPLFILTTGLSRVVGEEWVNGCSFWHQQHKSVLWLWPDVAVLSHRNRVPWTEEPERHCYNFSCNTACPCCHTPTACPDKAMKLTSLKAALSLACNFNDIFKLWLLVIENLAITAGHNSTPACAPRDSNTSCFGVG